MQVFKRWEERKKRWFKISLRDKHTHHPSTKTNWNLTTAHVGAFTHILVVLPRCRCCPCVLNTCFSLQFMLLLFTHNSPNQTLRLIRASSWHLSGVWQAGQLVKRREVLKVGVYFVPTRSSITDVRASRQMWSLSSDWKDIFPVSSDKHLFFGDVSSLKKKTLIMF